MISARSLIKVNPSISFNRLEGDRGAVNDSLLDWAKAKSPRQSLPGIPGAGVWMSLNHPIREGLPINFSAILPPQILPAYQSPITGLTVRITRGTPGALFPTGTQEPWQLAVETRDRTGGRRSNARAGTAAAGGHQ